MWQSLAKFVIKNRIVLLVALFLSTSVMGFYASKVKLSYEFSKAIPTDNQKYIDYTTFKKKFGDDGNLLVAGISTENLFVLNNFRAYQKLHTDIRKVKGV